MEIFNYIIKIYVYTHSSWYLSYSKNEMNVLLFYQTMLQHTRASCVLWGHNLCFRLRNECRCRYRSHSRKRIRPMSMEVRLPMCYPGPLWTYRHPITSYNWCSDPLESESIPRPSFGRVENSTSICNRGLLGRKTWNRSMRFKVSTGETFVSTSLSGLVFRLFRTSLCSLDVSWQRTIPFYLIKLLNFLKSFIYIIPRRYMYAKET